MAKRDRHWEAQLETWCKRYEKAKIAFVRRVHAEAKSRGHGGRQLGPVDFLGFTRGRGIAFEAKSSMTDRLPFSYIKAHQARQLDRAMELGAIAGIACRLKSIDVWYEWALIREAYWRWAIEGGRPASVKDQDAVYEIPHYGNWMRVEGLR